MKKENVWTGERLETFILNDNTTEHLHRYAIAQEIVTDKIVLDIASGEGYGSNLLAKTATKVIGVDISEHDVKKAKLKYSKTPNLTYHHGSVLEIPFDANYFDVVVSFETLEHLTDHQLMLSEIKRVLKDDGILIISTPDKLNYTDKTSYNNPFHLKELYTKEFEELLLKFFKNVKMLHQKMIKGSLISGSSEIDAFYEGSYTNINKSLYFNEIYNIIIASNFDLPRINSSVFIDNLNDQIQTEVIAKIRNSITYRVGNIILKPFSIIKRLLRKN
jgi:2-polyprenyl-3-methyl-5-hydroxy-6-metoxy-1,4-benzoquinol methylase